MPTPSDLFPDTYEESRARFRQSLAQVQARWPNAHLNSHRLAGDEDLTIDWIHAEALESKDRLLLFTIGEHGIEAYAGSAMLQLFTAEMLPHLDPASTGLLLVHPINPWGMKHHRRTNHQNVDLNRSFIPPHAPPSPSAPPPSHASAGPQSGAPPSPNAPPPSHASAGPQSGDTFNPDYAKLNTYLNPPHPIRSLLLSNLAFLLKTLWFTISLGNARFRHTMLLGQYRFPHGLYYGGESTPEETQVLMDLYRAYIQQYAHILHLDMHTGYGPRYQMSVVNSALEPRDSGELQRLFDYPLVVKANPAEFYAIQGDMIDYIYTLVRDEFPGKHLYATSFEFGTLGNSTAAALRSVRAAIRENQAHWFGTHSAQQRDRVTRDYQALFAPTEEHWRAKAIADARQAFQGILCAEGFTKPNLAKVP